MFFNPSCTKKNISENDIHLWVINPQEFTDESKLNLLENILSKTEKQKVKAYHQPKVQHNALITRAFVRSVLSLYIEVLPQNLLFSYSEHGKPELLNSPLPLKFNISHNSELIICAVSLTSDIGCDVESMERKVAVQNIAKRYFSPSEYQSLQDLDNSLQNSRFFEYWTLKEAFVKCTGLGISQGLGSFSFTIEEPNTKQYNANISLQFSADNKQQNSQSYSSYLVYPDSKHCIALCINSTNKLLNNKFNISVFKADGQLSLYIEGKSLS